MRTTHPPLIRAAIFLLLASLALAACAGASSGLVAEGPDGGTDKGTSGALPDAAPAAPGGVTGGETGSGDGVGAPVDDARIVRTGTMELEVADVPTAVSIARAGIRAMGGYVGASNTYDEGDHPVATITYRIPVDRWEDALTLLRGLNGQTSRVVTEQTNAVEVTGSVVDLEARIRNLEASETALQGIAERTVKVSDVLEVQAQLTAVRGEIESLTAQLADLENRADLATMTATYRVPVVATTVATQDWDPATVVDEATASLLDMVQALVSVGIWVAIVWLPILLVVGAVALVVTWIVRRTGLFRSRQHHGGDGVAPSGA